MFNSKKILAALFALAFSCNAFAQIPVTGAGTATSDSTSADPVSNACINSSGTTITFTAQGIGNAKAGRVTVISISWDDSTAAGTSELTAMTVGGISMARQVRAVGDNQNSNSEIWYVANPTGTTANIVATFSTAVDGITIEVYSLVGYQSIAATTTGTTSVSQAYTNKQVAIAAASRRVNVSTSLSNMTNDFSSACGASLWGVHASQKLNGNGTLSSTISPTSNTPLIALAVWQVPPVSPSVCAANMTGLIGNWDASVFASLTLSSTTITDVADQSGQGNNLGNGSAVSRPTYNATGLNSRPTMNFNGAQKISSTSLFPMGTGSTLTFYLVGTISSGAADAYEMPVSYGFGGAVNNTTSWYFSRESNTQAFRFNRNASALNGAIVYDVPFVAIGTVDSGGALTLYFNGSATTGATQSGAWGSPGNLMLGDSFYDLGTRELLGNISEVAIATGLSNSTVAATIYNCLKVKWGL